jgi:hypothetical protein
MSKSLKITIGVILAVVIIMGLGLLRWSSRVYWNSGGERGWSLGASVYQMMGWGTENYMADMGFQRDEDGWTSEVEVRLIDDDEDGVPDRGVIDSPARGRFGGKFGHHGFDRGFGRGRPGGGGCLVPLLVIAAIGGGIYFYRRRSSASA